MAHIQHQPHVDRDKQLNDNSFSELTQFLDSLEYPITRDEILTRAHMENLDEWVFLTLERLPDGAYETAKEIEEQLGDSYDKDIL